MSKRRALTLCCRTALSPCVYCCCHCAPDASCRQQPQHLQQQISQLTQQLQVVQQRASAKEASSRKYKEAVRAFKVHVVAANASDLVLPLTAACLCGCARSFIAVCGCGLRCVLVPAHML